MAGQPSTKLGLVPQSQGHQPRVRPARPWLPFSSSSRLCCSAVRLCCRRRGPILPLSGARWAKVWADVLRLHKKRKRGGRAGGAFPVFSRMTRWRHRFWRVPQPSKTAASPEHARFEPLWAPREYR
ncbi:hypothetical protein MRX96_008259 [Rhipicephalus microplus]